MASIRCGSVQFRHRASDKAYNLSVIEKFAREAAGREVRILAFPEMCITGYWHVRNLDRAALEKLSEPVPDGDSTRALGALAHTHDMAIGAGLIE